MIRQPIVAVLGHVDHGKTTLLDNIRKTGVASKEAGNITQHIGATEVPINVIKSLCAGLIDESNIKIPGLLFLDTPGHEAFTTLRKRGSSIADMAILIVDINEGIMPQTEESITLLKEFKTPFIVAANKVDKMGWQGTECFVDAIKKQSPKVITDVDNSIYTLMGKLSEFGFNADRFDRVKDFRSTISIIPLSGAQGTGVPEIMAMLVGLSQQFLGDKLGITEGTGIGSILEVKEVKGLGTSVDAILYDGSIKEGDHLVIGGQNPVTTSVRALLKPPALGEMRVEKKFDRTKEVSAACGIKIAAIGLEDVIAGMPFKATSKKEEVSSLQEELKEQVEESEIESSQDGVTIKADTLGSLEALMKVLQANDISIKRGTIGGITRKDVAEARSMPDDKRVIFAFNVPVTREIQEEARGSVTIFSSKVIYELIDNYKDWKDDIFERKKKEHMDKITRPGRIRLLKGYVFRQRKPAIVGIEVEMGIIRTGYSLIKGDEVVGKIVDIQKESESVGEAKQGDKVALSIEGPTVGRQIEEGDVLENRLTSEDRRELKKIKSVLSQSEIQLLEEDI